MDDNAPTPDPVAPTDQVQTDPILIRDGQLTRLYCEGMSQFLLGFPVSRLVLHDLVERNGQNPGTPETRHIVGEIVMPTAGLIDMAKNILAAASQNKALLLKAEGDYGAQLHASVQSIEFDSGPPP